MLRSLTASCLILAASVHGQQPASTTVPAAAIRPMQPAAGTPAPVARPSLLAPGTVAPDFVSVTVDGREVRLSDFAGKVVILDFWATWCGPCISSFPHTQAIAARYKDQGVVVLAAGTSDTTANFREWIPANTPRFPDMVWVFDPNERGSAAFAERASARLYNVSAIPTQYVIGADGKVVGTVVGNNGADDLRTEALLAQAGIRVDEATVTRGREQLEVAAQRERAREIAEANPRPALILSYGPLRQGEPAPDVTVHDVQGNAATLASLNAGGPMIVAVWSARGVNAEMVEFLNGVAERYAAQNVRVVGLAAYGSREAFDAWRAGEGATARFTLAFDPAGQPPQSAKRPEDMTEEELAAFRQATREHFERVAPMRLAGGVMAPIPHFHVFDGRNGYAGTVVGWGPRSIEGLMNAFLRLGVDVAEADRPARVYTDADFEPAQPQAPEAPRVALLQPGAEAPDFVTQDLEGRNVRLSDFRGKVVILDFWATWCGPCMAAMPHVQQVAAQYKDQGVVVLGSCTSDTRAAFEAWVRRNAERYPDIIWSHDAAERTDARASRALFGVGGIPTQFVIDREGRIVETLVGYMPGEVLLDAALAKAGIEVPAEILTRAEANRRARAN